MKKPTWPANPYNGHAVCLIGYDDATDMFKVATWGEVWDMSFDWFQKYCDESYAILNDLSLNSSGRTAEGFDMAALQVDLQQIGAPVVDPVPVPVPVPPAPPIPPTPVPPNPAPTAPLSITARGGGYWVVCLDDVVQSPQHSQPFEAVEHADKARWANPGAKVEIKHAATYAVA